MIPAKSDSREAARDAAAEAHIDAEALERSIETLRERSTGSSLAPSLRELLEAATELFACSGAGLMFVNTEHALSYVAATDEPARALEQAQEEIGRGPCVDSLIHDTLVQSADLRDDDRWPDLRGRLEGQPIRAVLGTPVHLMMGPIGSLNVYRDEPYRWDDSEAQAIGAFATFAGRLLSAAVESERRGELVEQLEYALEHRVTIERATGVLMGRGDLDAVEAFNQMRKASRDRRIKVVEVADRVLRGEWPLGDDTP